VDITRKSLTIKDMGPPDVFGSLGLCERCGMRSADGRVHSTPGQCIDILREEMGLLQLALLGKPGSYARERRRCTEGRGISIAARREVGASYPQPSPSDAL
jgi:hypothetical protein